MIKIFKTLGIIAVIAMIGFLMMSCETMSGLVGGETMSGLFGGGSDSGGRAARGSAKANPFIGIWAVTYSTGMTVEYIFEENIFTAVQNGSYNGRGEYSYTDTELTLKETEYQPFQDGVWAPQEGEPYTMTYTITSDTLTLERTVYKKMEVSHAREIVAAPPPPPAWNPPDQRAPVGNWGSFNLNANGTGTFREYASDNSFRTSPLTWTASGNRLTLNKTGYSTPDVYIYELSGNTLTIVQERFAANEFDRGTLTRQ